MCRRRLPIYPNPPALWPLPTLLCRAHPSRLLLLNPTASSDVQQPLSSVLTVRLLLWERGFSRDTLTGSINLSHLFLFQFRIVLVFTHITWFQNACIRPLLFVLLCVKHDDTCSGADISRVLQSNHIRTPILIPMSRYPTTLVYFTHQAFKGSSRVLHHVFFPSHVFLFFLHCVPSVS